MKRQRRFGSLYLAGRLVEAVATPSHVLAAMQDDSVVVRTALRREYKKDRQKNLIFLFVIEKVVSLRCKFKKM